MLVLLFRTFLIYIYLLICMRLTGKRQIGQLQVSELIIAFLLSELATAPLVDLSLPLYYAFFSIGLLVGLEVLLSFLVTKSPLLKKMLDGTPSILVKDGVPNEGALGKARISMEELLGQMRLKGFSHLSEIAYAFLEHNGQISFLPKAKDSPPSAKDLGVSVKEKGMCHALIVDGVISDKGLALVGKDRAWLLARLQSKRLMPKDLFLCTYDDDTEFLCHPKKKNH